MLKEKNSYLNREFESNFPPLQVLRSLLNINRTLKKVNEFNEFVYSIKIYKTIVFPVVLYDCETCSLTLREESRLKGI